jgi:hypothetical protein
MILASTARRCQRLGMVGEVRRPRDSLRQSCRPCYCHPMTKGELVIQLIEIGLGAAIGTYFIWWSLEMLHRLPPH